LAQRRCPCVTVRSIETPELLERPPQKHLDECLVPHVGWERQGVTALALDVSDNREQGSLVSRSQHDCVTVSRECTRGCSAYSATGAGDKGNLIFHTLSEELFFSRAYIAPFGQFCQ